MTMTDRQLQRLTAYDAQPITPSDTTEYSPPLAAFIIGVAGDIKVTTRAGSVQTFPSGSFAVGIPIPIPCTKIWSTGTTATTITGLISEW